MRHYLKGRDSKGRDLKGRDLTLAAVLVIASLGVRAQSSAPASPFPDGPGREVVAVACTQCHGAGPIVQLRMSEQGWRRQVYNMVLRGAQVGPEDIDATLAYLAATFGPGVPFPNQTAPHVTLPDGPGATLVAGGCGLCHGVDRVVATSRPGQQWDAIVHRMVAIGAPLTAEQTATVTAYLKAHYSPVLTAQN